MALGLGLRPRGLELALSIPLPPSFSGPASALSGPASALSGTAAAPMSKVLPPGGGANAGSEARKFSRYKRIFALPQKGV